MPRRLTRPTGTDPVELIKWLAAVQAEHVHVASVAHITSIDPDNWTAKVMLYPEEVETGWLALPSIYAGNGWGFWGLPELNTQVLVVYEGGDYNLPKIVCYLSNKVDEIPPQLSPGQLQASNSAGATLLFDTDGSIKANGKKLVRNGDPITVTVNGTTYTGTVSSTY